MSKQATLQFLTESLPTFMVGQKSSFQLQATGGVKPYTFRIASGNLPQGLRVSSSGRITGVARQPGDTTVAFEVDDAASAKATQAFDLQVETPARKA